MGRMIRKFVCWLVGCNYICLHRFMFEHDYRTRSTVSGWKCARCENYIDEQWDDV